jgi:dolichyl-phosphate beta-glucosyltransferase
MSIGTPNPGAGDATLVAPSLRRVGASEPVLGVVVPMYREAQRIGPTLRDILATLDAWARARPSLTSEVVLVDDGSTDATRDVVDAVLDEHAKHATHTSTGAARVRVITHDRNRGKGAGVRTGLRESRAQWTLMLDADNSARLLELAKLAPATHDPAVAMVIGSRSSPDSDVDARVIRQLSGLGFKAALSCIGVRLARDTQCGFKLYRRDLADLIVRHAREDGFAFDIEHLLLARRAGLAIREVGVRWRHADGGSIRVVRDGARMLRQAARIRRRVATLDLSQPTPAPGALVEPKPLAIGSTEVFGVSGVAPVPRPVPSCIAPGAPHAPASPHAHSREGSP